MTLRQWVLLAITILLVALHLATARSEMTRRTPVDARPAESVMGPASTGAGSTRSTTAPSAGPSSTSTSLSRLMTPATSSTTSGGGTTERSTPATSTPPTSTTTTSSFAVSTLASAGERRKTISTVYCVSGVTYSGGQTNETNGVRTAAVNRDNGEWERYEGTTWRVIDGPHAGRLYRIEDAGPKAHFDMWHGDKPDCQTYARIYGAQEINLERIS